MLDENGVDHDPHRDHPEKDEDERPRTSEARDFVGDALAEGPVVLRGFQRRVGVLRMTPRDQLLRDEVLVAVSVSAVTGIHLSSCVKTTEYWHLRRAGDSRSSGAMNPGSDDPKGRRSDRATPDGSGQKRPGRFLEDTRSDGMVFPTPG
jgi:hypothetical protein